MKALWALFIGVILAMAGGLAYQFLYPPQVMKRATEDALNRFSMAVETQDRAQVAGALQALLADDAAIRLEVSFYMLLHNESNNFIAQDFDKPSFLSFIDNILFTVQDYHYIPKLESFTLSEDWKTAAVRFSSRELAKGPSYYAGTMVMMRYMTETVCDGQVVFTDSVPRLRQAKCNVQLRMTPTSEGNKTLQTPEMLREMIDRN